MALHADPTLTLIPVRWIMTFSISKHGEFFNLQSFLEATIVLVTIIKRWGYTSSWRQQDGLSPLVSPFTGSVSKTALWIDSKLIFTCSKHDVRRQKKKPLRYKESASMHVSHKKLKIDTKWQKLLSKHHYFLMFIFFWK